MKDFIHETVLLRETVEILAVRPDGVYLDATLGGGGHAKEILKHLDSGYLYGIDQDERAIEAAQKRLLAYGPHFVPLRGNFRDMAGLLSQAKVEAIDGAVFDLGLSSPQLDHPERGFSYNHDAPLDMRMDQRQSLSAYTVVNDWPEEELRRILYEYGEERYAKGIARAIVRRRQEKAVETTLELSELVRRAMPSKALSEKQHPARRTFQAIRIAVGDELGALKAGLEAAFSLLSPGGVMAVISFHSLEERMVKEFFREKAQGCICPPDFPACVCGHKATMEILTRKAVLPSQEETQRNPRAHSAKMRAARKLPAG